MLEALAAFGVCLVGIGSGSNIVLDLVVAALLVCFVTLAFFWALDLDFGLDLDLDFGLDFL